MIRKDSDENIVTISFLASSYGSLSECELPNCDSSLALDRINLNTELAQSNY